MRAGPPALLVILALAVAAAVQIVPATLAMRATPMIAVLGVVHLGGILTVPLGALVAGVVIDRGGLRAAIIAGSVLIALGAAVASAISSDSLLLLAAGALSTGLGIGALTTAVFVGAALVVAPGRRPLMVAAVLVAMLPVFAAWLYIDPVVSPIILAGTVLAAGALLAILIRGSSSPPPAVESVARVAGLSLLLTAGVALIVAMMEPSRALALLFLVPLNTIEMTDLAGLRLVVVALGVLLIGVTARALNRSGDRGTAEVMACIALAALVGGALTTSTVIRLSMASISGPIFLGSTLGALAGIGIAAWWMRASARVARIATTGAVLMSTAVAVAVLAPPSLDLVGTEWLVLLGAALVAVSMGAFFVSLPVRTLVADTPNSRLGLVTAGSVVAASAGTAVGSYLASSIAFSLVEGENPFNHLVDIALLAASVVALVLLARRLPRERPANLVDAGVHAPS
jgi:hypothetical protein